MRVMDVSQCDELEVKESEPVQPRQERGYLR